MINHTAVKALLDEEGYLIDLDQWSHSLAESIAELDGFELSLQHWEVLDTIREFYQEYELSPAMRPLVKAMSNKYGSAKGNSIYLMKLFAESPPKQAARYAGLPKPLNCL
ncbi:MAG: tusE/DsrC/DsvC family sulfur relay protein [Osedax symbiont Rs1]|nr:MAG: tusE/DsrC/DsvC family sulfur relay protein [Osedax symbiont Rs1]